MSDAFRREFERRAEALRRYDQWQQRHPSVLDPSAAIESIGFLWRLLPPESRERPVDTSGIERMRRILALLR